MFGIMYLKKIGVAQIILADLPFIILLNLPMKCPIFLLSILSHPYKMLPDEQYWTLYYVASP